MPEAQAQEKGVGGNEEGDRQMKKRRREWLREREKEEAAGTDEKTSLNWEHVLECAQTTADEAFASTNSHSVEVSL